MKEKTKKLVKRILGARTIFRIKKMQLWCRHPEYTRLLASNKLLENAYSGSRCFILGNGPSINKLDFSLLEKEFVFTVNQLPRNRKFQELKSNFHLWSDAVYFDLDEKKQEDMEVLEVMKSVSEGNREIVVFYAANAYTMIQKYGLEKCFNIRYFAHVYSAETEEGISNKVQKYIDFTKIICDFPTVVHTAICLAVYMGFSEIYLLGCDCTGFLNIAASRGGNADKEVAYGYSISENEKKRLEKVARTKSVRGELQGYVGIFDDYALLKDYCDRQRVKLYNATEGSLLDCVPKIHLEDVLGTPTPGTSEVGKGRKGL